MRLQGGGTARTFEALTKEGVGRVLEELSQNFDYIVCDSPAGIEHGAHMAMYFADHAMVVTNAEVSSVRDSDRILGLLDAYDRLTAARRDFAALRKLCGVDESDLVDMLNEILAITENLFNEHGSDSVNFEKSLKKKFPSTKVRSLFLFWMVWSCWKSAMMPMNWNREIRPIIYPRHPITFRQKVVKRL